MSDKKDDDALGDLLSDELGEWDAMFDSLHEGGTEPDPGLDAAVVEPVVDPVGGSVPHFVGPTTPSGSFDIHSTIGAPFAGVPGAATNVDQLVPGDEPSSPFGAEEEDFGSLLGSEPEALGGLLGSGPIPSSAGATPASGLRPPSALEVRAGEHSVARAKPTGPDDAAFDDFEESTNIVPLELVSEMAKSAAAFFDDESEQKNEVSLELDDDFYDGIQIGDEAVAAAAEVDTERRAGSDSSATGRPRTFANVVRRPTSQSAEGSIPLPIERAPSESPDPSIPIPIERESSAAAAFAALASFEDEVEESDEVAPLAEESFGGFGIGNQSEGNETLVALAPLEDDLDALTGSDDAFDESTLGSLPNIETETEPELDDLFPNIETEAELEAAGYPADAGLPAALPPIDVPTLPQPLPPVASLDDALAGLEDIDDSDEEEPGSLDAALDDAIEGLVLSEAPQAAKSGTPESGGDDRLPEFEPADLAGVVEAAVEDAVAMSTGTLLTGPRLQDLDVEPDLPPEKFARLVPGPELGALALAEDVGLADADRTDEYARLLLLYGRELELIDEVAPTMRLRMEAGRIAESLGDLEQARVHFDEALKFDPHMVPANRALRRIEGVLGNWEEVIRLLGKELLNSSPAEADALTLSRIGLLMAVGELDLARVAVGELLDASPNDARALFANLDLSFVDGREDEIESTLDALSEVLAEPKLMVAVLNFCASLAESGGRDEKAISLFKRANEMLPSLGNAVALRAAALKGEQTEIALEALEAARQSADAPLRAGFDWQRSELLFSESNTLAAKELLQEAVAAAPEDLLLSQQLHRASSESDPSGPMALLALANKTEGIWQGQLLGRAARLSDGADALELYQRAAESAVADEFARAGLRSARVEREQWQEVYESAPTAGGHLSNYRRAQAAVRAGHGQEALQLLAATRKAEQGGSQPQEVAFLDLAYANNDQSTLSEYRVPEGTGGPADAQRAERIRSRARTRLGIANVADQTLLPRAVESWSNLADLEGENSSANDTACLVASLTKNPEVLLPRLEASENGTSFEARAVQAGVESVGISMQESVEAGAERVFALQAARPSERGALLHWALALGAGDTPGAVSSFETEAARVESEDSQSADRLLYRAAFLRAQDEIEATAATDALRRIVERRPSFSAAATLLKSLEATEGGPIATMAARSDGAPAIAHDNLSAEIRRAEAMVRAGDAAAAAELFAALLEANPDDALVAHAFHRACWESSASAKLAEHALAALRQAEEHNDGVAKAAACEELARIDGELRGDYGTALMFWESASAADPTRADLLRTLERELGNLGVERLDSETAWKALGRLIESLEPGSERCSYLLERARVGLHLGRPESEALADYALAFEDDETCREALFYLEAHASQAENSNRLADLEKKVSTYFAADARARAAFLVRAGETLRGLDQPELAMASFKSATETMPGFAPALFAWRELALDLEMWDSLAEACLLEAESVQSDKGRADLFHLAGVTLMDKAEDNERAVDALKQVLVVDALHRDAFVRLRKVYTEADKMDELAQLLSMRIEVERDEDALCELHHARARVLRESLGSLPEALAHVRAVLAIRPNDKTAMVAVSELAWELEKWAEAAEALMVLARVETEPPRVISVFTRLGIIYTDYLPEPKWALKSFRKVISLDPTNLVALARFAELSAASGDHKLALGAYEQLIKLDPPVDEKVTYLHQMAKSFQEGFGDTSKAERALRVALDLDLANEMAFDALIGFYLAQDNKRSARVHMDLVANAMRKRIRANAADVVAYRVIAHAMEARFKAGVENSRVVARASASIAIMLGDTSQAMKSLVASTKYLAHGQELGGIKHDELLYPKSALSGARALLMMLGDRLAKHVGTDVRTHGVGRSDRLRGGNDPIAVTVAGLATEMGLESPEVYISSQSPLVLAGEPTKPASLVFGKELISADRAEELRFLSGRLLKLASAFLSIPLRLGEEDFGVLLVGILRQFQPEFAPVSVDESLAAAEQQRLRRLIPSGMLQELAPFAIGLASSDFDHRVIWQGLVDAGNRAGLLCAGDVRASVQALMRYKGISDAGTALQDIEIANLVRFACSEDHASLYSAIG